MDQHSSHTPKKIQLPCILEVAGCGLLSGRTRELTEQEISMQFPNLAYKGARKPKVGTSGVLTFELIMYGNPKEVLRMPCRINYVSSIIVGVQINTQVLNSRQRARFAELLESRE
jgi:hypothetical protein